MLDLRLAVIFQSFAEQTVKGIQTNIRTKRVTKFGAMSNTDLAARSLSYRLTETGFEIFVSGKAIAYFDTLETGRKPGKAPPRSALKEWVLLRNLPSKWKMSADSAAFLVARKISQQGTTVFEQGGNTGIIKDWISEARIKELRESVLPVFVEDVTMLILGELKISS